jgi:hypothetical protein
LRAIPVLIFFRNVSSPPELSGLIFEFRSLIYGVGIFVLQNHVDSRGALEQDFFWTSKKIKKVMSRRLNRSKHKIVGMAETLPVMPDGGNIACVSSLHF